MSESVIQVFVDLYRKGKIYRGYRMVNWDPEAKTTVSDEEVIYKESNGKLYFLKYPIENENNHIIIATTRPETILGDTAICYNPNDERFTHLKGKRVIVPIANRSIPIIEDEYVDMEFGTGCLKITPAHDPNDKIIGEKHQLEIIDIFNEDATLNAYGLHYEGLDRFECRKLIVKELESLGFIQKIEDYQNKVGTSERTGSVIEPRLSHQWFLSMEELAQPALQAVMEDVVKLIPAKFKNTYRHWMENVRDWNISRQLWWGHRIPAWYYGDGMEDFVVAQNETDALELARVKTGNPNLSSADLNQDPDVLDTWFSSWLWPISVFDGIRNPDNPQINYYYPTNDLITAPEILFFWVARMIIAGYEYRSQKPFEKVYLTGIVRDKLGRKMSKSLGNSPDPLLLISNYGADGVRLGMLLTSPAGNDLPFDEAICEQGRNFSNKIWNALRLVKGWDIAETSQPDHSAAIILWMENKINQTLKEIDEHFEQYRLSDALMTTYKLLWDDFCSTYLEVVKPVYGQPIDKLTIEKTIGIFETLMQILHPFMPFITEEIWHLLRPQQTDIIISHYPEYKLFNEDLLKEFDMAYEVITAIRNFRKQKNIPQKETVDLFVKKNNNDAPKTTFDSVVKKLGVLQKIEYTNQPIENAHSFLVESTEFYIPFSQEVDLNAELERLTQELNYNRNFLAAVEKKLSNERFVANAPAQVVELEKKKRDDAMKKIVVIENQINAIRQ